MVTTDSAAYEALIAAVRKNTGTSGDSWDGYILGVALEYIHSIGKGEAFADLLALIASERTSNTQHA